MNIEPITLIGRLVRLEPLQMKHAANLYQAGQDPTIWTYMSRSVHSMTDMEQFVAIALQDQANGTCLPFAIIDLARGRAIGSTRYLNIAHHDRGLEIGWTWLTPAAQRSGVNTECKYLLLRHAFEVYGVIRVQLRTHHSNFRSQQAIERLGAVREGVLRNHMIMPDGSYRHSVFYSILDSEWPRVKVGLEEKMQHK